MNTDTYSLLQIYKNSTYLQNLLEIEDSNNTNQKIEQEIKEIFKQIYKLLNLNITYEKYITYLLDLTDDYKYIKYTVGNIFYYVKLSDYFQLNIQDDLFNYILDEYVLKNKFYHKLYSYQPLNYYILDRFCNDGSDIKNNIYYRKCIVGNTYEYIFRINEHICKEIKILNSHHITQHSLNKCVNVTQLNICDNSEIININCLQLLVNLNMSNISNVYGKCSVNQNGISSLLFIKKLNVVNIAKIIDVNHCNYLKTWIYRINVVVLDKMEFHNFYLLKN